MLTNTKPIDNKYIFKGSGRKSYYTSHNRRIAHEKSTNCYESNTLLLIWGMNEELVLTCVPTERTYPNRFFTTVISSHCVYEIPKIWLQFKTKNACLNSVVRVDIYPVDHYRNLKPWNKYRWFPNGVGHLFCVFFFLTREMKIPVTH